RRPEAAPAHDREGDSARRQREDVRSRQPDRHANRGGVLQARWHPALRPEAAGSPVRAMTSSRLPRNLRQEQVVNALVRAGGVLDTRAGKGSHVKVTMPGRRIVFIPSGVIATGTLGRIIARSGLTRDEFMELL